MLGKSPIKWRQRPDMTLAVDWDFKHQTKPLILADCQYLVHIRPPILDQGKRESDRINIFINKFT